MHYGTSFIDSDITREVDIHPGGQTKAGSCADAETLQSMNGGTAQQADSEKSNCNGNIAGRRGRRLAPRDFPQ